MRVGSHPMAGNVGNDARWMHASYIGLHHPIVVAANGLTSAKTIPFLAAEEIANYLSLEPGHHTRTQLLYVVPADSYYHLKKVQP
jgi:hypothetical protein